jgi:hypothetical protein
MTMRELKHTIRVVSDINRENNAAIKARSRR